MLRLYHNKTLHGGRYNHRKIISQYIAYMYKYHVKFLCSWSKPSLAALGTKPARLYIHK